MTETTEEFKQELLRLPSRDRAELAHILILSLDEAEDVGVEAAWDAELDRRMKEIESGTEAGEFAESVFAQLRQKYSS